MQKWAQDHDSDNRNDILIITIFQSYQIIGHKNKSVILTCSNMSVIITYNDILVSTNMSVILTYSYNMSAEHVICDSTLVMTNMSAILTY